MSTKINSKQRTEFLEAVLRETFAPRFDEIQERMAKEAAQHIADKHPGFVKACADPEIKPYLAITQRHRGHVEGHRLSKPDSYGKCFAGKYHVKYSMSDDGLKWMYAKVDGPAYHDTDFEVSDALAADYHALWAEFAAAQRLLTDTIYSYTNREKFEADFPHLAKYLPKPATVVSTSVAVQVGDVMEKLAKMGIPPSGGEA